jgi:hypothetical protein
MTLKKCIAPLMLLAATLTIVTIVTVVPVVPGRARSVSYAAPTDNASFSLTVTIKSRHISHFETCIPVRVEEPFRVVWGNAEVKDSFSGVLHAAKGQKYPVTLHISEGAGSCREMSVPSLTLDKPDSWSNLVSMAFQHIDSREVTLSKSQCQQPRTEQAPPQ